MIPSHVEISGTLYGVFGTECEVIDEVLLLLTFFKCFSLSGMCVSMIFGTVCGLLAAKYDGFHHVRSCS